MVKTFSTADQDYLESHVETDILRFKDIDKTFEKGGRIWSEIMKRKTRFHHFFFNLKMEERERDYAEAVEKYEYLLTREENILKKFSSLTHEAIESLEHHYKRSKFRFEDEDDDTIGVREVRGISDIKKVEHVKKAKHAHRVHHIRTIIKHTLTALKHIRSYLELVEDRVEDEVKLLEDAKTIDVRHFSEKLWALQHRFRDDWFEGVKLAKKRNIELTQYQSEAYNALSKKVKRALAVKKIGTSVANVMVLASGVALIISQISDVGSKVELLSYLALGSGIFLSTILFPASQEISDLLLDKAKHKHTRF